MINYLLVEYRDNWADEMNIAGFIVATQEQWDAYLKLAASASYPLTYYIGTNEEIEYPSHKLLTDTFRIKRLDDIQRSTLVDLFGVKGEEYSVAKFGFFPEAHLFEDVEE